MRFLLVTASGISVLFAAIIFAQPRQSSSGTWLKSPVSTSGIGCQQTLVIGTSVTGLEIKACQIAGSTIGSNNAVLVIGTIHGDEPDGRRVVDELLAERVPGGTEIWVIRDGNPDGSELLTRRNANKVDLNRNFPIKWLESDLSLRTYSGPGPASEPETKALMSAVQQIKPTRIVVFHQPFDQIDCPPDRTTQISDRLSELTGYRSECIPGEKSGSVTNSYTGTFTIWVNNTFPKATAITFELGLTTMDSKIETISNALHILATDNTYLP